MTLHKTHADPVTQKKSIRPHEPTQDERAHADEVLAVSRFLVAFRAVEHEVRAVPDDKLAALNVDVTAAVPTVCGALERVAPLRARLAAIAELDHAAIERLPLYADALWFAHARYVTAASSARPLALVFADCDALLGPLLSGARALRDAGLLPSNTLDNLGVTRGYLPTALDTSSLVEVLRAKWPTLEGHTALTPAQCDAADLAATALLHAVSRKGIDKVRDEAAKTRLQAFTLFAHAYAETRRGVAFLRYYEDDANDFAPGLTANRRSRKKPAPTPPATAPEAAPTTHAAPTATPEAK